MTTETTQYPLNPEYRGLVGNDTRDEAVAYLTLAYGEGYLTAEQHDSRTRQGLQARNDEDIRSALANLPDQITRTVDGRAPRLQTPGWLRAVRCLFIASATACVTLWGMGALDNPSSVAAGALTLTSVLASLLALVIVLAGPDGEFGDSF
jgi:hypothetical protein